MVGDGNESHAADLDAELPVCARHLTVMHQLVAQKDGVGRELIQQPEWHPAHLWDLGNQGRPHSVESVYALCRLCPRSVPTASAGRCLRQ